MYPSSFVTRYPLTKSNPPRMFGWRGLSNGEPLQRAEREGFDLLIVADKNLRHQQDLSGQRMAILELWTNHRPTLEQNFPRVRAAVDRMKAGQYLALEGE